MVVTRREEQKLLTCQFVVLEENESCDQLWIIIFSLNIKKKYVNSLKKKVKNKKIKLFHHTDIFKKKTKLNKIDEILKKGTVKE